MAARFATISCKEFLLNTNFFVFNEGMIKIDRYLQQELRYFI